MDEMEIIAKFIDSNICLHPSVFEELRGKNEDEINRIIAHAGTECPDVMTLEYLKSLEEGMLNGKAGAVTQDTKSEEPPEVEIARRKKRGLAEEHDSELEIRWEKDVTRQPSSEGKLESFIEYFNYRYETLAKILRARDPLRDAATIEWAQKSSKNSEKYKTEVKIIGMVNDVRPTKKGHVLIELEDPTGVIPTLVLNSDRELIEASRELMKDEVIGIEGTTSKGKDLVIIREIFFPDVPVRKGLKKSDVPLAMAMLSDIHVGSEKFLEDDFLKFLKWLKGDLGNQKQRELAQRVKYLVIGGDLVDGVGIYPEQERELKIKDIYQQYAKMAEYLTQVPDHIEIVVIPGNHDAVRQAEPQPAIMEEYAKALYDDPRIHMTGNPSFIKTHGVEVLSYHGRSLDDVISTIPGTSYANPDKAMLALVKKRHLAPVYGGKVPLAPVAMDFMLVDEVPDIFHFGHVHAIGVSSYRGTVVLNSGTFQEQTSFQRKHNVVPTPSQVPIIDLQAQRTTIMRFDL
ncbi:MAG: DNA-directed DNA polymerase II small subunit [Desulfatiglandales bacterium]